MFKLITETSRPVAGFQNGIAALWIFSAGVSAMGIPDTRSSQAYRWLFRFLHLLAANLDRAGFLQHGDGSEQNPV